MGQINITTDDSLIAAIDRVASARGITRPDLLRKAMHELVEAHDADRLAFAREEGPRLDSSLTAMAVQLREAVTELDRAQRENQKLSKRLIEAWNGGEAAARAAQERISALIADHLRERFDPYRIGVDDVLGRVQALPAKVAETLGDALGGIGRQLAENRELAAQPRTATYLSLSDRAHVGIAIFAAGCAAMFLMGMLFGLYLNDGPEPATKDPVLAIVPTPASACRVVNYVFASKDCRIPEAARQRAVDALREEKSR
ncbi:MAG: hypothetical protein J0M19_13985 [Sphingomonadales bacterium]|nr:hypothetical protein [Sphingomonadales bacterium]